MAVMASLANLIAALITAVLRLMVTSRVLKMNPGVFIRIFNAPFVSALAMVGTVSLWRGVGASLPDAIVLTVSILLGAVVYVVLLFALRKSEFQEAYTMMMGFLRRDAAADDSERVMDADMSAIGGQPVEPISTFASD